MREDGARSDRTADIRVVQGPDTSDQWLEQTVPPFGNAPEKSAVPPDFARIAKRIVSRTTDLIVVGTVAVAALAGGRQVVEWWHYDPPAIANRPETQVGWDQVNVPILLEFGDYPLSLERRPFRGSPQEAQSALERQCQQATESAGEIDREPHAAESRLLEAIADLKPIAQQDGSWELYSVANPLPIVFGVRRLELPTKETAGPDRRLICWGMVVPVGADSWLLYLFQPASAKIILGELPAVPAPPGGHRILSLRDERGGGLVGVSGAGPAEDWMAFYDKSFAERGWKALDGWTVSPTSWSAVFYLVGHESGNIAVRISGDGGGRLVGMVSLTTDF